MGMEVYYTNGCRSLLIDNGIEIFWIVVGILIEYR